MAADILIQNVSSLPTIPTESDFIRWVEAALDTQSNNNNAELCIRLVDKEESADLNYRYRKKSGPTNILSFPSELPEEMEIPALGDLVICAPLVEEEAKAQNKIVQHHWAHLTIHGILHLLGYDHEEESEALNMENLEIAILAQLNYPNPY